MPLTAAHPAAVLPLLGRRLPTAALVIGSLAPDLVYYLRFTPQGRFGHTLPGLFLFCLPAGLALLWTLDRVLRRPVLDLVPDGLRGRMESRPRPELWSPRALALASLGVLAGAVTHDVWDAFTHGSGWGTDLVPWLRGSAAFGPDLDLARYKLAQHLSTGLGIGIVVLALRRWWRETPPRPSASPVSPTARWTRLAVWAATSGLVGAGVGAERASRSEKPLADFLGSTFVVSVSVGFLLALAYAVAVGIHSRRRA